MKTLRWIKSSIILSNIPYHMARGLSKENGELQGPISMNYKWHLSYLQLAEGCNGLYALQKNVSK